MKLPRWLVIGMLTSSVLAMLGIPGIWWVTWPQHTAREFVEHLHADQKAEARKLISIRDTDWDAWGNGLGTRKGDYYPGWLIYLPGRPLQLKAQSRSLPELMRGEQEFLIGRKHIMRITRGNIVSVKIVETP